MRSQPHSQSTPTPAATAVVPVSSASLSPSVTAGSRTSTGSTGATIHPPPKLPPRALSPAAVTTNSSGPPTGYGKPLAGSTSSSASVPASVVARLATTPAPAPALSPRAQLISPPPNVAILTGAEGGSTNSVQQQQPTKESSSSKEKSSSGVSLMKRLTSRKKSSPPLLNPYSIDNPVFEDGFLASTAPPKSTGNPPPTANCLSPAPVHVRSGSCPSQLLQMGPVLMTSAGGERPPSGSDSRPSTRHSMGGSQRLRSNKHRPNILPSNAAVFSRSISASGTVPNGTAHESMAATGSTGTPRDKRPRNPASPGVTERYGSDPALFIR